MKITRLPQHNVSTNEAVLITKICYGINGTAIELNGERDRNFLIINPDGKKFILKISNPADSQEIIDFQNQLLFHLASKITAWKWQKPQAGLNGRFICDYEALNGNQLKVRLLTFLDGIFLSDFTPHDFSLMHDLGDFIGHISQSLSEFTHPAMHRKLFWDLKNGVELTKTNLNEINDNERIDKISYLIDEIESTGAISSNQLRERVIYNDPNHHNILLKYNKIGKGKIVGAIDFGDSVFSWLIGDLAIACTYSMLNKDIPLEYASSIVKGFNKIQPLNEIEISALFSLICLRTCMSVTIAAHHESLYPNNPYLLITQKPAWNLIDKLIKIPGDLAQSSFRQACGLETSNSKTEN